jgi:hypothetical protein
MNPRAFCIGRRAVLGGIAATLGTGLAARARTGLPKVGYLIADRIIE